MVALVVPHDRGWTQPELAQQRKDAGFSHFETE